MPNRLQHETSPYLIQHADNPVNWYPWGEEAFRKAKEEDKPLFLSIGYSTCHWCHVMAHESFEDEETAEILNRYFISVKVDKEERPDVDSIYMAFLSGIYRQRWLAYQHLYDAGSEAFLCRNVFSEVFPRTDDWLSGVAGSYP